jgi:hypothetical protein
MPIAELHTPEVVCLAEPVAVAVEQESNRRTHHRLKAGDLQSLKSARIKYGADVRVIDLSIGGMLLETQSQLMPDASVIVELTGQESPILVPSRVLRCRIASLGEILRYQGACAFKRPLKGQELSALAGRLERASQAAPAASPGWQKAVARFKGGRIVSGYTNDFHPSKPQFHLSANPRQGEQMLIPMSQLKALFFVREFDGDSTLVESKDFVAMPQGRKVEVTFHDNEVIVGSTLGYRGEGNGFFLHPADSRSNNLRVFVTAAGARQVRFL